MKKLLSDEIDYLKNEVNRNRDVLKELMEELQIYLNKMATHGVGNPSQGQRSHSTTVNVHVETNPISRFISWILHGLSHYFLGF